MALVSNGGYKGSGDTAEQEKRMVMLRAAPGVVPFSVPSLFLHPAQEHSVTSWAFLVLVTQPLQFPEQPPRCN